MQMNYLNIIFKDIREKQKKSCLSLCNDMAVQ